MTFLLLIVGQQLSGQSLNGGQPSVSARTSASFKLYNSYLKSGKDSLAFKELTALCGDPARNFDSCLDILKQLNGAKKFKNLSVASGKLLSTHPHKASAWWIYAQCLSQEEKYADARDAYLQGIKIDSGLVAVWEQILILDEKTGSDEDALSHVRKVLLLFPDQPEIFVLSGSTLIRLNMFSEAVKVLNDGLTLVVKNDKLTAQFYMNLGEAWHKMHDDDRSDYAFEISLKYDGNNIYALNNFAYYLSLRNKDMNKAERMIRKALELSPDNPSFNDTYSWVLYKLGRYREALERSDEALKGMKDPACEVLDHHGDILYSSGKLEQAVEFWKKAKAKGDCSEFLDKKISERRKLP